jgi:hypothetical protein
MESNSRSLKRLVRLMTEPESVAFRTELGLAEDSTDHDVANALGSLPRYDAVRILLRASDSTLLLLRDVFESLDSFGLSTRTTGCVFVLANPANPAERREVAFSQQTVSTICSWSLRKNWNRLSASLQSLQSKWHDFEAMWQHLLNEAEPRSRRGRLDPVKSFIQQRLVYDDRDDTDKNAQIVLFHFYARVQQMADRLVEIPSTRRPLELETILQDVRNLERAVDERVGHHVGVAHQCEDDPSNAPDECTLYRYVSPEFTKDFDKFFEDIYLLSDLIRGEELADMLRINLWSSRPQLFEVWVMLKLLRWLRGRGYDIEILKTDIAGQNAPFRWNLSYSKDSMPCAVVRDRQTRVERFMFYQLYRPTGDMPDISLLEGANPSSPPVWSVDPKHSERGAYSLADYQETAERYRDSFGAKLSLIVEYFDRPGMGEANPIAFDSSAKLIRSCRPEAPGMLLLMSELAPFHPTKEQALVCIDFSSSFSANRNGALERMRQQFASRVSNTIASECICFAGNTTIVSNFNEWQSAITKTLAEPDGLVDGTASGPLIQAIAEFTRRIPVTELFLITDGEFDIPIQSVVDRIREEGDFSVTIVSS